MFDQENSFTVLTATVVAIVLLVFSIGFLINWYRNRAAISAYKRLGFIAGLIVVGFELLIVGLSASSLGPFMNALPIVLPIGWLMLRVWAFVNNGIFFSNQLGLRSFQLLVPHLGAPRLGVTLPETPTEVTPITPIEPATNRSEASAETATGAIPLELPGSAEPIAPSTSTDPASVAPAPTPIVPINWSRYWLTTLGVGLGAVVYSVILFALTLPAMGAAFRDLTGGRPQVSLVALALVLEFAFTEELIFRLGIQNYLAAKLVNRRNGYWIAIVLTSILWTLGHVGALDPDWVKLVQIFPVGLALGWLYRRQGVESTIIAHSLFNLIGAFVISIR